MVVSEVGEMEDGGGDEGGGETTEESVFEGGWDDGREFGGGVFEDID